MKNSISTKTSYTRLYKDTIAGDCHISCKFNWLKSKNKPPNGRLHGIKNGWYNFPFNFDPIWMEEECEEHSIVLNPEMEIQDNPLFTILSILK